MTESSISERGSQDQGDTRRRIWAIVGASSGNLVEWFDFSSIHFAHSTLRTSSFLLATPLRNCYKLQGYLRRVF